MRRRSLAAGVLPVALLLLLYGPALGRYFTSEDFLLMRFLGEHPPWRDPDLFTGPWLGITVVKFYRPVSTVLYGLEIAAFGVAPLAYNTVHTLVHAANTLLVLAIMSRLVPGALAPVAAAVLFALYPLHPNAVLFAASFATVFGACFMFASLLAYQQARRAGRWGWWPASLGLFVLALGSYEASAVLPAILLAYEILVPREEGDTRRGAAVTLLPFFGLLGAYLLMRRAVFGVVIGGYDDVGARLREPGAWLHDVVRSIYTLYLPTFDRIPALWECVFFVGVAVGAPLTAIALGRFRFGSARLWAFAWLWTLLAQAPFAFRPCVPANGRFWYVAAAGAAMATAFLARAIAETAARSGRVVAVAVVAGMALSWGWLLTGYLEVYVAAGHTTQAIQRELVRVNADAPSRIFVTGYPMFLVNAGGAPIAQVFHYGLRDAVNPPFVSASVPVHPLLPLLGNDRRAILAADPGAVILAWDAASQTLRRLAPAPAHDASELVVQAPAEGAVLDPGALTVDVRPGGFRRFRVVVVARGNATVVEPTGAPAPGGSIRLALPAAFVTTMARLYPDGEFLWWLDANDGPEGRTAFTRMRSFRLRGGSVSAPGA